MDTMFKFKKEDPIPKDFDPLAEKVANILIEKFIKDDKLKGIELVDTKEGTEAIKAAILSIGPARLPRINSIDSVITQLRKKGVIKPLQAEPKVIEEPKLTPTEYGHKFTEIETDENTQRIIKSNKRIEKAVGSGRVFRDKKEIEEIYEKALELQKERTLETPQYYYEFAESGVIKGKYGKTAREVVEHDLELLEKKKQTFRDDSEVETSLETAKQISGILERGLAYSATEFWYGKNVTIKPTSEFDDVRRGIDEVLEIKNNKETKHLGLGIDITFDELDGDYFFSKVSKILESIEEGYKSRIKYHKDSNGKMMEEFAIPKIILGFDIKEVGEIAHMIRHIDDQSFMEAYKKHPLKFDVMNRIVSSCNKLGTFAEKHGNDISIKYFEVINTIKEAANQNPEMKDVLNTNYEDKFTKQLDKLIKEFKKRQK